MEYLTEAAEHHVPPLFSAPIAAAPYILEQQNVRGRRCGHVGRQLVLARLLRSGARCGDFDRRHFSGRFSHVPGRVSSHRLRLRLYAKEVSGP